MPIRVLCLHGMGTNADLLKHQTAGFRDMLPSSYEFIFPDGPLLCSPPPGSEDFVEGNHRCWWDTPTTEKIADAHAHILQLIKSVGGVDMILGFSQGAATAASILLHHAIENPHSRPLCKAAIFICSPLPFSKDTKHGIDVRQYFGIDDSQSCGRPSFVPEHLVAPEYFRRNEFDIERESSPESLLESSFQAEKRLPEARFYRNGSMASSSSSLSIDSECSSETDVESTWIRASGPYYNMFHAEVDRWRIQMPTAHVYGATDEWRMHSKELQSLCDTSRSLSFEHDGGHQIPRAQSEELCDLFEDLVSIAGI